MTHQTLHRRLEALEARQAPPVAYVWREAGESEEEAIKLEGIKSSESVVFFTWHDGG